MRKIYLSLTGIAILMLLLVSTSQSQITVTGSVTDATCNGACDGSIDITPSGGTGFYTYLWSNTTTSEDPAGLCAGTYSVTVTESLSIPFTWAPTPNPSSSTILVLAATATIDGTGLQLGDYLGVFFDQNGTLACGGYGLYDAAAQSAQVVVISGFANSGGDTGFDPGEAYSWKIWRAATGYEFPLTATYPTPASGIFGAGDFENVTGLVGTPQTIPSTGTYSGVVGQPVALGINGLTTNVSINGGSDGAIDITVSNAVPAVTYLWSNTATTEDLSGLPLGTYTVTATDANACTVTDSWLVTEPTNIVLSANITNPTCFGGSDGAIDFTVSGGVSPYTINWSNSETTEDISGLIAAAYNVTVMDANSAVTTGSYSVTQPAQILLSANITDVSCNGLSDGAIDLVVTNGVSAFTYLWANTSTTEDLTGLAAVTLGVTVTDANQCTGSGSFTVGQPDVISLQLTTSDYFGYGVSAYGATDGTIDLTVSGGNGGETFAWSNTATSEDLSALAPNTYTVSVTDSKACSATGSATITEPADPTLYVTGSISNASCFTYCDGAIDVTITGGITPYTINWSNLVTVEDQSALCAGTYTVTVVDNGFQGGAFDWSYTITGQNTHVILIPPGSVTVDGLGATSGDYIGVFYDVSGTLACGGYYPYTPDITPTNPLGNTVVSAQGSEPGLDNGFQPGEAFFWKLYRQTDGAIIDLTPTYNTVIFANGGSYVSGGLSGVSALAGISPNVGPSQQTVITSFTVTEPAGMTISLTASDYSGYGVSQYGASDGTLTSSITGGTPSFTYLWSNNATTANLSGLAAGPYTLTVTDASSCTATGSAVLTEPAQPANFLPVTGIANDISCFGLCDGSIDISVTGGTGVYEYIWSNQATTQDLSGLCDGTYTVTVSDAGNPAQQSSISYTIGEPNAMSLTLTGSDYSGFGVSAYGASDGSVTTTVSGGTSAYSYLWSNTATSTGISNLSAGTYSVTVTDQNQCSVSGSQVLTSPPVPALVATGSNTNVDCNANCNATITLSVSGGVPTYSYAWSNQATTMNLTGLCAGTYTVTVSDSHTPVQQQILTFTVTEPAALSLSLVSFDYSGYGVSAFGATDGSIDLTVSGGSSPYFYVWSGTETTEDISGLAPGSYSVTVTDFSGCSATGTATITEPPMSPMAASGIESDASCNGVCDGSVDVTVSGGIQPYTYMWSNTATTQDVSGLCAGTYTVTVSDSGGTTSTGAPFDWTYTNTGNNHTIFVGASSLSVDGAGIQLGDYIGVFFDSLGTMACAGYMEWNALAVASNGTAIAAWGVDAGNDGFGPNEVITFKYYRATDGMTIDLTPTYGTSYLGNPVPNAGNYLTGGMSFAQTLLGSSPASSGQQQQILTFVIGNSAALTLSAQTVNVSCNGGSDGSISLTVNNGTAPFTYTWSNSATTAINSGLSFGTYDVTVVDANGCEVTGSYSITEPGALALTLAAQAVLCNGGSDGSIDVTASGGTPPYSYTWSLPQTGEDLANVPTGTYSVTVSDANNCTVIDSDFVAEPTLTDVTGTVSEISCFGFGDGSINITVSGGTAPHTFAWSNQATTEDVSGLFADTYTVSVTDNNNCLVTETFTVTEPAQLMVSGQATDVSCFGGADGTVSVAVSGGTTAYTYMWSNQETTEDLTDVSAATYMLTVSDANACTATGSYTVSEPTLMAASAQTVNVLCNGDSNGSIDLSVTDGTPGYTYLWSNQVTTQDIGGLAADTYTVTITDANGCTITAMYTITQPDALNLTGSATDVSCFGGNDGSIDLGISGGTAAYGIMWSNQETTEDIYGLIAGTYTVVVTDANGCSATASYTVGEPILLSVSGSATDVSCFGGSDGSVSIDVFGGTQSYTYSWSNQATTEDLSGLPADTYMVTVIDANGCTASASFVVNQPAMLMLSGSATDALCYGGTEGTVSIDVSGGTVPYSYAWSNSSTMEDLSGLGADTYTVVVTDDNGCTATDSYTVNEPAAIVISEQITHVSCYGGNDGMISVSVSGGTSAYTYAWTNGPATATYGGLVADTYTLVVSDANGCTTTASYVVDEPAMLSVTGTAFDVSCFGMSDGSVTTSVSGGTAPYTYDWGNFGTGANLSAVPASVYNVVVTDMNGCTASAQFVVGEPTDLSYVEVVSNVSCFGGSDGAIDIEVSGGTTPYMYDWSNTAQSQDVSGLTMGSYSVIITDANGCTLTGQFYVSEPSLLVVSGQDIDIACNGASNGQIMTSVSGGTPPYSYSWSNSATTANISGLGVGTYTVVVSDANGCTASALFNITQPNGMSVSIIGTDATYYNGPNAAADLTVTGGLTPYTFMWTGGYTTEDLNGVVAGPYHVTVTDANGCEAYGQVTMNQPPMGPDWFYTNTGINHTISIPASADLTVDGLPLVIGDWIGVFYDSLGSMACGGYVMYDGQTTALAAFGAQAGSVDGFTTGEEFTWKVWKALEDVTYDVVAEYMPIGIAGITDQQFFASNGLSGITVLQSDTWGIMGISFPVDWSMVSLNVYPDNNDFAAIIAPIIPDLIIAKSETGASYWPFFGINQIGQWIPQEAYSFNMWVASFLVVEGIKIDPVVEQIDMPANWSMIAYLRQDPGNAITMMASIAPDLKLMKNSQGWVYWPLFGFNSIGNMNPGEGYLISMFNANTFFYPANSANSAKSDYVRQEAVNYNEFRNTGSNMSVAIPESAWDKTPESGDEIGIFTSNGMLVGSAVYDNDMVVVPVWANDKLSNKVDGMNENEAFVIKVWNRDNGKEEVLNVSYWEMGDGTFIPDELALAGKLTTENLNENTLGMIMPNPVKSEAIINFSLSQQSKVSITVYNVLGDLIEVLVSEEKSAGNHSVNFNADFYSTGSYFYKMETAEFSATRQLNIVK
jgi:hypothetical protein